MSSEAKHDQDLVVHKQRMQYHAAKPDLMGKLFEVSTAIKKGVLEESLRILVDLRASQINGCAFCVDMHSKQAKLHGERELRLYMLPVWRESNVFTARERIALELTEAVTHIGPESVSDELFARARETFSDAELTELVFAIVVINAWNRLSVTFRATPGSLDKQLGLDKAALH